MWVTTAGNWDVPFTTPPGTRGSSSKTFILIQRQLGAFWGILQMLCHEILRAFIGLCQCIDTEGQQIYMKQDGYRKQKMNSPVKITAVGKKNLNYNSWIRNIK
jgi:hypothetical protein